MCIYAVHFSVWVFINDLNIWNIYYYSCFSHSITKKTKNLFAWSSWTGGTCHRYIPTNTVNFYCGSSLQGSCIRIFKLSDHIFHLPVYFLFVPDSAVFQTVVVCGGIRILLVNVISKLESMFVYSNKLPKLGFYTM